MDSTAKFGILFLGYYYKLKVLMSLSNQMDPDSKECYCILFALGYAQNAMTLNQNIKELSTRIHSET